MSTTVKLGALLTLIKLEKAVPCVEPVKMFVDVLTDAESRRTRISLQPQTPIGLELSALTRPASTEAEEAR